MYDWKRALLTNEASVVRKRVGRLLGSIADGHLGTLLAQDMLDKLADMLTITSGRPGDDEHILMLDHVQTHCAQSRTGLMTFNVRIFDRGT